MTDEARLEKIQADINKILLRMDKLYSRVIFIQSMLEDGEALEDDEDDE